MHELKLSTEIEQTQLGMRLDQALSELFPDYSRSRIKDWIVNNKVTVNNITVSWARRCV